MTPDPAADSAAFVAPVVLRVENHHLADVVVSVTHGGVTNRLVNVAAASSATVPLPPAWVQPASAVTIIARALGGSASAQFRTAPITVRSGQRIVLTLESGLQRASVSVF
jgi:broad specificity phosphatase PhoE